eukprot:TRINITY_DN2883_c0_g1_i1.p1 TRINITY_DN2883_c0_g1~~TRINITY_DN2883_c0_g1_i1.p1  ORF type:complete len:1558 (-),score=280.57 TRINITY_DN2883_c0_g1_i1:34-4707(-)
MMERNHRKLRKPAKSASTSEGKASESPSHRDRQVPELDLESIASTVQEVSASSSVEGSVLPEDTVLARISARYSRNLHKAKLQPQASRRAVRIIESLPSLDAKTIDEWGLSSVIPTCSFLKQSTKAARPGENFVCNIKFGEDEETKIEKVKFHRFLGGDGIVFLVNTEDGQSFYLLVRLVINEVVLELASSLSAMEGNVSDPDGINTTRWLDTGLNPSLNSYYQPQGLMMKSINPVADDRRSLYLPFVINPPESEQYKGRRYRLLFNILGDNNPQRFAISKALDIGENIEYNRRRTSKLIVDFLETVTDDSHLTPKVRQLLQDFVSSYPKTIVPTVDGEKGTPDEGTNILLKVLQSLGSSLKQVSRRRNYDGKTLLHYTCALKSVSLSQYILEKDSQCLNTIDINSQGPIWTAIDVKSTKLISLLFDYGANLKIRDLRGYNPLEFARSRRPIRHKIVRKLAQLDEGVSSVSSGNADGGTRSMSVRARTKSIVFETGFTDLELSISLRASEAHLQAFHGNFEKLTETLSTPEKVNQFLNNKDINGTTALHQAIRGGHDDVFFLLLSFEELDLGVADIMEMTPLMLACYYSRVDFAKHILERTIGKKTIPVDQFGFTPIHVACLFGYSGVLSLFLGCETKESVKEMIFSGTRRHSKEKKSREVDSPYYLASLFGQHALLKTLIDYDKTLFTTRCSSEKVSPLHIACKRGHLKIVQMLVTDYKMPVDSVDKTGATPAILAARNGHEGVLAFLLASGASMEKKDPQGHCPLHMAALGGHTKALLLLSEKVSLEVTNKKGETALCLAIYNGHLALVKELLKHKANVNHCIPDKEEGEEDQSEKGKDKDKEGKERERKKEKVTEEKRAGMRPVHLAAAAGKHQILEVLVDSGADVNVQDKDGKTPLMLAVPHLQCVAFLVKQKNILLDMVDDEGKTALYHALASLNIKSAKEMILQGSEIHIADKNGKSPLDLDLGDHRDIILDVVKTRQEKSNSANAAIYKEAVAAFNQKASQGIDHLTKAGLLKNPAWDIAWFFANYADSLSKIQLGLFLGGEEDLKKETLLAFTSRIDFSDMSYDRALRHYLHFFMLPGEAQKIDRIMECFAHRYFQHNPGVFPDADTAFILAFSLIMLNTDLHNPSIKNKMTKDQFLRNNRGQWGPEHEDPPRDFYMKLYDAIAEEEIEFEREGYMFGGAERKGYLKKFSPPRTWTKRYFILKESCLYYFKGPKDEEPYGIIVLENLTVTKSGTKRFVLSTKDGAPVKYCKTSGSGVMVQGTQKEIILCTDTELARNEWMNSLQTNVSENPFYELIRKRIDHLVDKAQSTQEIYLTSEHVTQYLEWCALCQEAGNEKQLRDKWGDSLILCSTEGLLRYALIEDGKVNRIAFTQDLWVPELIQHLQKTKSTKFDFMEHFQIQDTLKKISKKILPNIRKYGETQICGYGLGSVFAIHMGLLLQSQGYTVKRVLTFGQPKVIAAKDFSSCNLLGLVRVLIPKDPAACLFDNHAHAGQQLVLTSKPQFEAMPTFGDQVSVPVKVAKNLMKKGATIAQDFSLASYSKALSTVKL